MNRRDVAYQEGAAGIWHLEPSACPLTPHLQALQQKNKGCCGGIATNMQGPMVVFKCPHFAGSDSVQANGEQLTSGCMYPTPPPHEERDDG